jgi:hypothetical protein
MAGLPWELFAGVAESEHSSDTRSDQVAPKELTAGALAIRDARRLPSFRISFRRRWSLPQVKTSAPQS